MKYLLSVVDSTPDSGTPEEMVTINAFNQWLRDENYWVLATGLYANAKSVVVDNRDGHDLVAEGPLNDTAEWMSGFWIVDVPSHEEALRVAKLGSQACYRRVEVRAFH
jgi:hypothetical protein